MTITIKSGQSPKRNEPCPCGSGLKYKQCHGDVIKQEICNRVANEKMIQLIYEEKKKKELLISKYHCNNCNIGFDELKLQETLILDGSDQWVCPKCNSTNFVEVN